MPFPPIPRDAGARALRHPGAARSVAVFVVLFLLLLGSAPEEANVIPDPTDPPGGTSPEFIVNGTFDSGLTGWDNVGAVTAGAGFARTTVSTAGYSYDVQLRQVDHNLGTLVGGVVYCLRFQSRIVADPDAGPGQIFSHPLIIEASQHQPVLGAHYRTWALLDVLLENAAGDTSWHDYAVTFRVPDDIGEIRLGGPETWLGFLVGAARGAVDFDNVSLLRCGITRYDGTEKVIGTFEPADEYWHGADLSRGANGLHELRLSAAKNGLQFAYKLMVLDIAQLGWDLTLQVRADHPENVGRMYVILRSGPIDFVFHSFHGLQPGVNTIRIGSELTTPDIGHEPAEDRCYDQSHLAGNGRVCDLYKYWFASGFDWHAVYTVGIKLEANGNGPADVYVDDLRIVPWTSTPPPPTRRPPVASRVGVQVLDDRQVTIRWETDQPAGTRVEFSKETAATPLRPYAASVDGGGTPTVSHEILVGGLEAYTRYHARVVSRSAAGLDGVSGDFTFVTEPTIPLVPRNSAAFYPVGMQGVGAAENQTMAVHAGFNSLFGTLYGGCGITATAENDLALAFLNATQQFSPPPKTLLASFCLGRTGTGILNESSSTEEIQSYVGQKVDALETHPSLYGYYLFDEPELADPDGRGPLPEPRPGSLPPTLVRDRMEVVRTATRAHDLSHPLMSATTFMNASHPYQDLIDLPLLDNYPSALGPAEEVIPGLADTEQWSLQTGKPFHHVIQAYNSELDRSFPVGPSPLAFRTEQEMSAMAWLGIVYGARGTWAFAESEIVPFPGTEWIWAGLANVARDLRRFEPLLASTEVSRQPTHPAASVAAIRSRGKAYQGSDYLITVNAAATGPTSANLTVGAPSCGIPAAVLGENRQVTVGTDCKLVDSWGAYDTQIYRLGIDAAAPAASITSPPPNAKYSRGKKFAVSVPIKVRATDNIGVSRVEFFAFVTGAAETRVGVQPVSPPAITVAASYTWSTGTLGTYTLRAKAYDVNGNLAVSTDVPIKVQK